MIKKNKKEKMYKNQDKIEFVNADLFNLPFKKDSFKEIIGTQFLSEYGKKVIKI